MNGLYRLYSADIAPLRSAELYRAAYRAVSARRREKTDQLRFEQGRMLSIGVELLLMSACHDFGISYEHAQILENEYGKPYFSEIPLFFSLSHSGDQVLCAMGVAPVGCDIEQLNTVHPGIAGRFFSADENRLLEKCTDEAKQQDIFYRIWTLKESFIKCTGHGLSIPLGSFCALPPGIGKIGWVRHHLDQSNYAISEYAADAGYRTALCIQCASVQTELQHEIIFQKRSLGESL